MRPHILVVEDDTTTRETLQRTLLANGCDVEAVADGELAVVALTKGRYDVILLDLVLPKMSGTDVMEWVASAMPEVLSTIVVVTGLEATEIRKLFPEVHETLSKPVIPTRLLAAVRRCLGAQGRGEGTSGISVA